MNSDTPSAVAQPLNPRTFAMFYADHGLVEVVEEVLLPCNLEKDLWMVGVGVDIFYLPEKPDPVASLQRLFPGSVVDDRRGMTTDYTKLGPLGPGSQPGDAGTRLTSF